MSREILGEADAGGRRFAIVAARFNELVTERLVEGARSCLLQHGAAADDVDLIRVPGAWELPGAAGVAIRSGRYAGVVAVGCVIRGETPHFDYVAGEAARGLQDLAIRHDVPVGLGLLTTDNREHAVARAGGEKGNKGWEAALATLEMADLYARLAAT